MMANGIMTAGWFTAVLAMLMLSACQPSRGAVQQTPENLKDMATSTAQSAIEQGKSLAMGQLSQVNQQYSSACQTLLSVVGPLITSADPAQANKARDEVCSGSLYDPSRSLGQNLSDLISRVQRFTALSKPSPETAK